MIIYIFFSGRISIVRPLKSDVFWKQTGLLFIIDWILERILLGYSDFCICSSGPCSSVLQHVLDLGDREKTGSCSELITKSEIRLFGTWLILAIIVTQLNILNIGNWAHIGGLLTGLAMGLVFIAPGRRILGSVLVAALLLASLTSTHMSWNEMWVNRNSAEPLLDLIDQANTRDPDAQALYGSVLVRTRVTEREGAQRLKNSAVHGSVQGMNSYAWLLATSPSILIRNGRKAVHWALQANEATDYRSPEMLDTLAASYARDGSFDLAVQYQRMAIEHINSNDTADQGYSDRLFLYRSKLVYTGMYGYQ